MFLKKLQPEFKEDMERAEVESRPTYRRDLFPPGVVIRKRMRTVSSRELQRIREEDHIRRMAEEQQRRNRSPQPKADSEETISDRQATAIIDEVISSLKQSDL